MISYTPTAFINDSPPAITAAELNKIGLAIKALIDGDADQAIAALKNASILDQDGKLNTDIIDNGSIDDDMLSDVYVHLYFGASAPSQNTNGHLGDIYIHTYTENNTTKRDIYQCYDGYIDAKIWEKCTNESDLSAKMDLFTVSVPPNNAGTGPDTSDQSFTSLSIGQGFFCTIGGSRYFYIKTSASTPYAVQPHNVSQLNNDSGFITQAEAPEIFIGSSAPTTATGGKRGDFFFHIHTVNNTTERHTYQCQGKSGNDYLWEEMPKSSDLVNERPRIIEITIQSSSWNNNAVDLSTTLSGYITNNTMIDIIVPDTTYDTLKAAGCERLWVENNNSIVTLCAKGTAPSSSIAVCLMLSEVRSI